MPGFAPFLDPVSPEHDTRRNRYKCQQSRKTQQQPTSYSGLRTLEEWNQTR